jgi:hypothetical protein
VGSEIVKKIVVEIVKHPETRFEVIPKTIKEGFDELDSGQINHAEELKFTQRLKKYPDEYKGHPRIAELAKLLEKDKADLVYWYETSTEVYVKSRQRWKKKKSYSVKSENPNLEEYKNLLLNKLKDTLEIAGFNIDDLRLRLAHATISEDMGNMEDEAKMRQPTHNIHSLILNRWSPRSMTGEGITDEDLMGLFEAARWAPSSYNNQPCNEIHLCKERYKTLGITLQPFG